MSNGQDHKPVGAGPDRASESLNDALDNLEDMLDLHDGGATRRADESVDDGREDPQLGEAQYSIPLLSDVVSVPPVRAPETRIAPEHEEADYAESVERMAERLSSEIDIIVQSAVDEAIDLLRRDIAERVREHLDITLPEVLEELVHLRRR